MHSWNYSGREQRRRYSVGVVEEGTVLACLPFCSASTFVREGQTEQNASEVSNSLSLEKQVRKTERNATTQEFCIKSL